MGAFVAHGPEAESAPAPISDKSSERETTGKENDFDFEAGRTISHVDGSKQESLESDENTMAQLMGVGVLEFGIVLHRHVFLRHLSALSANRCPLTEACF